MPRIMSVSCRSCSMRARRASTPLVHEGRRGLGAGPAARDGGGRSLGAGQVGVDLATPRRPGRPGRRSTGLAPRLRETGPRPSAPGRARMASIRSAEPLRSEEVGGVELAGGRLAPDAAPADRRSCRRPARPPSSRPRVDRGAGPAPAFLASPPGHGEPPVRTPLDQVGIAAVAVFGAVALQGPQPGLLDELEQAGGRGAGGVGVGL